MNRLKHIAILMLILIISGCSVEEDSALPSSEPDINGNWYGNTEQANMIHLNISKRDDSLLLVTYRVVYEIGGLIVEAYNQNLDCLITGEVGHSAYHLIKESGITVITLGHYRSETLGVKAIMEEIKQKFPVECRFIDIPTGL